MITKPNRIRGDLMRQIGLLYGRLTLMEHGEPSKDEPPVTRDDLKRQIVALTKELMAL